MAEVESGLSLMGRLSVRPKLVNLVGPGVDGPRHTITPVLDLSKVGESSATASFLLDTICKVSLPISYRDVEIGGDEATILMYDCDHHVKAEDIARELQRRVKGIAERHFRSLPREARNKERLTSTDQWQIVKRSMERILLMVINTPDQLEISLLAMENILSANLNISLVLINSINTFYHLMTVRTGIFHNPYVRRLLTHVVDATQYMNENLKVLYTQLNYFNREDNFYDNLKPNDKLFVIKDNIRLGKPDAQGQFCVFYRNSRVLKNIL